MDKRIRMGKSEEIHMASKQSPCLTLLILRDANLNNSKNWQWCGEKDTHHCHFGGNEVFKILTIAPLEGNMVRT